MSTDKENIDRLFDSLEDHSMEADFDQFGDMEIRLEKLRYFRFGWKHFNIYYSLFIGLSILPSAYLLGSYFMQKPAENKVVPVVADSIRVIEQPPIVQPDQPKDSVVYIYKDDDYSAPDTVVRIVEVPAPVVAPLPPPPVVHDTVQVPAPPKIARKIVVIPKRDTIIKFDTTKVIKRK